METYRLNNGMTVPKIGFGTYKSTAGEVSGVLETAIAAGYRYFDTASFYENEKELGRALAGSGLGRGEYMVASKVWKTEMGYEETKAACARSLARLGLEYLDLYLIHWPKVNPEDTEWVKRVQDTWRAMEELYAEGKVRAIGLSNFLPHHIQAVLETARIRPAVDQLELHPGYFQKEAVDFCRQQKIQVQAWSPMGRRRVLEDALLQELAEKYGKSTAQICLRAELQLDIMPLPKASAMERMQQNLELFDFAIAAEDMERILAMPQTGWSGEHPDRARVKI